MVVAVKKEHDYP
jgi:hypothetical protein